LVRGVGVLVDRVREFYVFPDVGTQVQQLLRRRLCDGAYRNFRDEKSFANAVSADLQSINGDPHLFVVYSEQVLPERGEPTVAEGKRRAERARLANDGFTRVDRLPGNIGLLELRNFYDPAVGDAVATAVAAMQLLASADALLIDLRHNTGGEPEMVALLLSFLYDEPTHLVDLVFPASGHTQQFWTAPYVPRLRFGGSKPLHVLISSETFSAAERFSYQLQQEKRATLIGEGSIGAPATFHYRYRVSEHLLCAVPSARRLRQSRQTPFNTEVVSGRFCQRRATPSTRSRAATGQAPGCSRTLRCRPDRPSTPHTGLRCNMF